MTISGYDSSSISTLFSSLSTSSSSSSSSSSGLYSIDFSEYQMIRNGTYYKLLKAYYASDSSSSSSSTSSTSSSTSTSEDSTETLANIEDASEDLSSSAEKLYTTSNNTVFEKDENGNYDTDAIYKAVSNFVDDYNSLVTSASSSSTTRIQNALSTMKGLTSGNSSALEAIGITINSTTGSLSIDEDTFKNSNMDDVKSLFNGKSSYAYSVSAQASLMNTYAEAQASISAFYTSTGTYSNNYTTGDIISYFT